MSPGSALAQFSDADASRTIVRALRWLGVIALLAAPLLWWKMGWRTAAMFAVGAAISAASLWKWLRLMAVLVERMDAPVDGADGVPAQPRTVRPLAPVLIYFVLTLGVSLGALYGSLKLLDGSVYALFAGLALGVFALLIEALRLVKAWTI
jgi:hypothetical protein